jgi:pimeloyl-ACP methyl ester carboxylesterase
MPYATNPADGVRTYFEDSGGAGPPVLFYTGLADPLEVAKASRLARTLGGEFRLIFADHRGKGGSDKPQEPSAYALATRVADAVAVLDALGIERAHFLGSSWGARLGFALGRHAPERVVSLVLCVNQPYAWNLESPTAQGVAAAVPRLDTRAWTASWRPSSRRSTFASLSPIGRGPWRRTIPRRWRLPGDPPRSRGGFAGSERMASAVSHLRWRSGRDARRRQESG